MNKKRSAVWSHFKETEGNKVACRICNKSFTKHGNTSFMLRHLRRTHPFLSEKVMEVETEITAEETAWEDDPLAPNVEGIDAWVEDLHDSRKRSAVWQHFQESENKKVSCKICSEKLTRQGNTSSMLRHLRRKHPHVNIPLMPTDNSLKKKALHIQSSHTEARILQVCEQFKRDNLLTDCTLVAEGQFLDVHRLVLASYSESFEEIFKTVMQPHPVIVLRDITMAELKGLISFMYKGETLIRAHEVAGLLKAANHLKVKGLTQVGLPDSWVNNADSSQTGNAGAAQFGSKEDFAHCQQDAQNYADMEEAMDHSHLGYTKREPTLDLMSMCEDVDIGGGTSPNKSNIGGKEDNLVRRVQIKVESGVDLPIIDRDQPASCNLQQDDPHTATHYISAGEEVVVHHEASDLQHSHSGDGIIQGDPLAEAITVTQKGTDLGAHTITKSITEATPVMDVGSVQQTATATRTIDEGLIILGLGSETHTTIISAGPSTPIKTTTKTVRPSMQYKARKYTKQDMQTAVKLVQEGHMGLKPAAKAFSIPATTLLRTTKRKEFQSTPDGKK